MLNIAVVDPQNTAREPAVAALRELGHTVYGSDCAETFDDELSTRSMDLMIIAFRLPGESGLSLVRRLRETDPNLGIIVVTPNAREKDKIDSYRNGADICLAAAYSLDEMLAAVKALMRRLPATVDCRLKINPTTLQLQGIQSAVDISNAECALLLAFAHSPDRRLATQQMLEIGGKGTADSGKSTLEVQIVRLRKKLEQASNTSPTIKAIRGFGYQLCLPLQIAQPDT